MKLYYNTFYSKETTSDTDIQSMITFLLADDKKHLLPVSLEEEEIDNKLKKFRKVYNKPRFGICQFKRVCIRTYGEIISVKHPTLYNPCDYIIKSNAALDVALKKSIYLFYLVSSTE